MDLTTPKKDLPCLNEPIHIFGYIQSHGYLIAIDSKTSVIKYVSENIENLIGFVPWKILNKRFSQIIDSHPILFYVEDALKNKTQNFRPFELTKFTTPSNKEFLAIGHFIENYFVIEFEPFDENISFEGSLNWIDNAHFHFRDDKNLNNILNETLIELRKITHFDRIMVYKFHEDGHGEVIAEDKEENIEPFLGLHFPDYDIPPIARELLLKNWVRSIVNVNVDQIKILNSNNTPLNMSYASLRSVSGCHIEYLQNMGVDASMVISIAHNNKLWGLISCHHYLPKYIGFHRRTITQLFGRFLSLIIPLKEQEAEKDFISKNAALLNQVLLKVHGKPSFLETLKTESTPLLNVFQSCGMAYFLNGEVKYVGKCPSENIIRFIIRNYNSSLSDNQDERVVEQDLFEWIKSDSSIDSNDLNGCFGLLCYEIPESGDGRLMFFRGAYKNTIAWAGNPNGDLLEPTKERLTPRVSFDLFLQEVKEKAKNWSRNERQLTRRYLELLKDEFIHFYGGELKRTISILETVYNDSLDALFLITLKDNMIYDCNLKALDIVGVNQNDEIIGKTLFDIFPNIQGEIEGLLGNAEIFNTQIKSRKLNSDVIWGSFQAKVIEEGNLDLYLLRVIDITELVEYGEQLEQQNEELKKVNHELDHFVYQVSHDLRSPIAGSLGLIQIGLEEEDADEIRKIFLFLKRSMLKQDEFIRKILDYSRNARRPVQLERVNLYDIVQGIVEELLAEKIDNLELKNQIDPSIYIDTDLMRLRIVLFNLTSNALKFRDKSKDIHSIQITFEERPETYLIAVIDNGIGISTQFLPKIFDMFFRASSQASGTGIGLYLVKEASEMIGAKLDVKSKEGEGSTFQIILPKNSPIL